MSKVFVNIRGYLVMLLYLLSTVGCFAVDETDALSFLSQRRKTPSLLFVHIKAPSDRYKWKNHYLCAEGKKPALFLC
jgi:hypothetical protein